MNENDAAKLDDPRAMVIMLILGAVVLAYDAIRKYRTRYAQGERIRVRRERLLAEEGLNNAGSH
jgi:hypothetical protein